MNEPTCEQISNEELKLVSRISDPSWRHGTRETEVYHRVSDDTYWEVKYRLSTDGETNELREGLAEVRQVKPVQKVVTIYE